MGPGKARGFRRDTAYRDATTPFESHRPWRLPRSWSGRTISTTGSTTSRSRSRLHRGLTSRAGHTSTDTGRDRTRRSRSRCSPASSSPINAIRTRETYGFGRDRISSTSSCSVSAGRRYCSRPAVTPRSSIHPRRSARPCRSPVTVETLFWLTFFWATTKGATPARVFGERSTIALRSPAIESAGSKHSSTCGPSTRRFERLSTTR